MFFMEIHRSRVMNILDNQLLDSIRQIMREETADCLNWKMNLLSILTKYSLKQANRSLKLVKIKNNLN
jgi:hypothetical protein